MISLAAFATTLAGRPLAVFGLGASGLAVVAAARQAHIDVIAWDDNAAARAKAAALGARIVPLDAETLSGVALLCLAPGIPLAHPAPHAVVLAAREADIEITGDIEIMVRARRAAGLPTRMVGITGTNGKSTTTALLAHVLDVAGIEYAVGGNIGLAVASLPDLSANGVYVIEISSYQIDLLQKFRPDIAVHLNFSPDHLDRHGGFDGYVAAKERLFDGSGIAVIGTDDTTSAAMATRIQSRGLRQLITFNTATPLPVDISASERLKGAHNRQNAVAATLAARALGVDDGVIARGLFTFPGLPHRQYLVDRRDRIVYINDSKATNDDAAATALAAYDSIFWIAGGQSKGGGYAACEKYLAHVRHAFLIGSAAAEIAAWLKVQGVPYTLCGTLENAVTTATAVAIASLEQIPEMTSATVLLSPACASFDQFSGYAARGDAFAAAVAALPPPHHSQRGSAA